MGSFLSTLLFGAMLVSLGPSSVFGHGRLWEPPGRSTMWRRGFATPANYNDNELNCGGFNRQVANEYKCGVCGDPYDGVRENEEGGKYATGVITRTYQQGQTVLVQVEITANHKGYFEFKLCPKSSSSQLTTQACLDQYPLALAYGTGSRYTLPSEESKMFDVSVVLPPDVTCNNCVIQWRYHAGNSWGTTNPDGTGCIGCGLQEEFYGCADVQIVQQGSGNVVTNPPPSSPPSSTPSPTIVNQPPASTSAPTSSVCRGIDGRPDLDAWCKVNCAAGFCPASHCQCSTVPNAQPSPPPPANPAPTTMNQPPVATTVAPSSGCRATDVYANVAGMNAWCVQNCAAGNCPSSHCICT